MRLLGYLHAALCAAALAACGGDGSSSSGEGGSTSSSSSAGATVGSGGASSSAASSTGAGTGGATGDPSITASVDPTTMAAGSKVTVTVTVTNFKLVAPKTPNVAGEGHYHVYLDGAQGGNYLAAGQTPTKLITIPANTMPGPHTLRVNISNNDHSPLSPPVEDILPITVE